MKKLFLSFLFEVAGDGYAASVLPPPRVDREGAVVLHSLLPSLTSLTCSCSPLGYENKNVGKEEFLPSSGFFEEISLSDREQS